MLILVIFDFSSTKSVNTEEDDYPQVEEYLGDEDILDGDVDYPDGDVDYPEVDEGLAK